MNVCNHGICPRYCDHQSVKALACGRPGEGNVFVATTIDTGQPEQ